MLQLAHLALFCYPPAQDFFKTERTRHRVAHLRAEIVWVLRRLKH